MCYNYFVYYETNKSNALESFGNGLKIKVEKKINTCINCDNTNITLLDDSPYIYISGGYKWL